MRWMSFQRASVSSLSIFEALLFLRRWSRAKHLVECCANVGHKLIKQIVWIRGTSLFLADPLGSIGTKLPMMDISQKNGIGNCFLFIRCTLKNRTFLFFTVSFLTWLSNFKSFKSLPACFIQNFVYTYMYNCENTNNIFK